MRPARRPTPGTDNERLLDALIEAYPQPVWRPNSRLNITAHSRAAELRKLGWDVEAVSKPDPDGGRKRVHGYRLSSIETNAA